MARQDKKARNILKRIVAKLLMLISETLLLVSDFLYDIAEKLEK